MFFFIVGNVVLFTAIMIFYKVEQGVNPTVTTMLDAVWWGLTTITTVGFGDVVPVTVEGRIVGLVLMATGVALYVGATALFVTVFFAQTREEIIESERLTLSEYKDVMAELSRVTAKLDRLEARLQSADHASATP